MRMAVAVEHNHVAPVIDVWRITEESHVFAVWRDPQVTESMVGLKQDLPNGILHLRLADAQHERGQLFPIGPHESAEPSISSNSRGAPSPIGELARVPIH